MVRIRKAKLEDLLDIYNIIRHAARTGAVLERSQQEILEHLRDFIVAEAEDEIVGVVALHFATPEMCEVRSLVVAEKWRGLGVGKRLLSRVIKEAKQFGFKKIFVLAQAPHLYLQKGFKLVPKEKLPNKIWKDCVNCPKFPQCDEEAYVLFLSSSSKK